MTKTFNERFDDVWDEYFNDVCMVGKEKKYKVKFKQFIQKEIEEVLEEIEKQRIPPNTLVAVTIWNRCIDKAKQIINKRFNNS